MAVPIRTRSDDLTNIPDGLLSRRTDHWAAADRTAWGERPLDRCGNLRHLARLRARLRPVADPPQLVHCDLTGNVLFHPKLPPAVIDVSPYWRPRTYASAIVVADALVWEGADLARALVFRLVAERLAHPKGAPVSHQEDPYTAAVALALALTGASD